MDELELIRHRKMLRMLKRDGGQKPKVLIEILTSPTCPYCPMAVRVVEEVINRRYKGKVEWREVSTATQEGMMKAIRHQVQGVPTVLIHDKILSVGVPSPQLVIEAIERELSA